MKRVDDNEPPAPEPKRKQIAADVDAVERGTVDEDLEKLVNDAYNGIDGYAIAAASQSDRRSRGEYISGLTYGEVDVRAFAALLRGPAEFVSGESFADLGCGTGKALCVATAIGARRSEGAELVKSLCEAGERAAEKYKETSETTFVVKHQDMFELDVSWADVLFVSTTCLDDEVMERLNGVLKTLGDNARVITTTRPLPASASDWALKTRQRYRYGKGVMTFHVYIKKA